MNCDWVNRRRGSFANSSTAPRAGCPTRDAVHRLPANCVKSGPVSLTNYPPTPYYRSRWKSSGADAEPAEPRDAPAAKWQTNAMTTPDQFMQHLPDGATIRDTFQRQQRTPRMLRDFMRKIAPAVGDSKMTQLVAVVVSTMGEVRAEDRAERLEEVTGEINFPARLRREIRRAAANFPAPDDEQMAAADRLVVALDILTQPFTAPDPSGPTFPIYQTAMSTFQAVRDRSVQTLAHAFITYGVTPPEDQERYLEYAIPAIHRQARSIHAAARICDFVIHTPNIWLHRAPAPDTAAERFDAAREQNRQLDIIVNEQPQQFSPESIRRLVNDLILEQCRRARSREMPAAHNIFTFWDEVVGSIPRSLRNP